MSGNISFTIFADAQQRLRAWLTWYNTARPHQALGCRSPTSFERHIWFRWPHDEGHPKIHAHNSPRTGDRHPVRSEKVRP